MVEINPIESVEHNSIATSNLTSKKPSKYISFFDYFDKSLIVLVLHFHCVQD